MGPASAASALATDGPGTPAASRWDGFPRSDEKHPSGLQARLSKGMADYDDLFQAEGQTTALIPWPTVCGRSDGRVEGRRHPDDCCVPPLETAVVATSTSPELCSDGTRPVTIVYVSLATRTHPTSPVSYCVSRQVHSGNVHNGTGRAAHPLRTSLRGESLQWKIQGGTVSARLLS